MLFERERRKKTKNNNHKPTVNQSVASHTSPDPEWNRTSFGVKDDAPTNRANSQGSSGVLMYSLVIIVNSTILLTYK